MENCVLGKKIHFVELQSMKCQIELEVYFPVLRTIGSEALHEEANLNKIKDHVVNVLGLPE